MQFQVKQKILSIGDNFIIQDQNGHPHYQVSGQVFSFGDKLSLEDLNGHELFYIEQKLMRLMPEYYLYKKGQTMAICKKRFTLFGSKFDIESQYGNFEINGYPLNYTYEIIKDGKIVATVDKQLFSFSDTYGVEINESEDYAFILSLIIIIDQVVHEK